MVGDRAIKVLADAVDRYEGTDRRTYYADAHLDAVRLRGQRDELLEAARAALPLANDMCGAYVGEDRDEKEAIVAALGAAIARAGGK